MLNLCRLQDRGWGVDAVFFVRWELFNMFTMRIWI